MEPGGCRAGRRRKLEGKGSHSVNQNFNFIILKYNTILKYNISNSIDANLIRRLITDERSFLASRVDR